MSHVLRMTLLALVVASLAVASRANTLGNGFVWDDRFIILDNPVIRSLRNIPDAFRQSLWHHMADRIIIDYYRPAQTLSFMLDYRLWGVNPAGYHAVNVLIHALNSVLMCLVLLRLLSNPAAAGLGAAVFALHPALSESVAFVSDRNDLLLTLMLLACLLALLRGAASASGGRGLLLAGAGILLFNLGLYSKETALAFIPVILAVPFVLPGPAGGSTGGKTALGNSLRLAGLLAATVPFYLFLRRGALGAAPDSLSLNLSLDPAVTARLLAKYFALMLCPWPLNADHHLLPGQRLLNAPQAVLAVAALIFLIRALGRTGRRREILLGLVWFAATILPVCRLFKANINLAERYLYLPSGGLILALTAASAGVLEKKGTMTAWWARAALAALLALAAVMGLATFQRNRVWRDERSLWADTYEKSPLKFSAANRFFDRYRPGADERQALLFLDVFFRRLDAAGMRAESPADFLSPDAEGEVQEAIKTYRSYVNLLIRAARLPEASLFLNRLYGLDRLSEETVFLGGVLALYEGRYSEAVFLFSGILDGNPGDPDALYNRALAYEGSGRPAEARGDYAALLLADPGNLAARTALERLRNR